RQFADRAVSTQGDAQRVSGGDVDREDVVRLALVVDVPSLSDDPGAIRPFAEHVLAAWTTRVGGPPRSLADDAYGVLESEAWAGDRSAVESLLWTALASTGRDPLTAADLDASGAALALATAPIETADPNDPPVTEPVRRDLAPDPRARFAEAPVIPPSPALDARDAPETAPPVAPSAETADLERAFAEGLPEATLLEPDGAGPASEDAEEAPDVARFADEAAADTGTTTFAGDGSAELGAENFAGDVSTDAGAETFAGDVSTELGAETFARAAVETPSAGAPDRESWRRLARSLSHEIRNPLVSIRTFTELLAENFDDAEFRDRFRELVGRDVAHIDEVVGRLSSAAAQEKVESTPVDVSALLERLLDDRRDSIGERRLLVLRELEREAPVAWADPTSLEVALAGLLDRALASLPERGDLFVATRRIDRAADGHPRLRILLRHHDPERRGATELGAGDASGVADVGAAANVLEYVLAETIVEAGGGQLTVDATDGAETLILVDLPTPL
ncbi:MAG: histidine kinase dimerization/phospho-acceptor domain-containing protein, partial [Myxococcota bacterium]